MAEDQQGKTDAGTVTSGDAKAKTTDVAPAEAGKPDPKSTGKTEKVVRYVGTADVREIDAASFTRVGAEGQTKTVWNAANNHTVKADELSETAVTFLETQDDFKVEDVES